MRLSCSLNPYLPSEEIVSPVLRGCNCVSFHRLEWLWDDYYLDLLPILWLQMHENRQEIDLLHEKVMSTARFEPTAATSNGRLRLRAITTDYLCIKFGFQSSIKSNLLHNLMIGKNVETFLFRDVLLRTWEVLRLVVYYCQHIYTNGLNI